MSKTRIFLSGYNVMASIGVHPHEQIAPQLIRVDVTLDLGDMQAPKHDRLAETLNYEWIAELIENQCTQGHVQLIETLTSKIAKDCLGDERVRAVRVRIEKPGAIAKADAAGVEIFQER